jgi:uncharacterized protein
MRIVVDTNVLLSGLMLPASVPGRIVTAFRDGKLKLAMSEPLIDELSRAMAYPKVRRRIQLSDEELERFVTELRFLVHIVDASTVAASVPRDRGADIVLAAFLASEAVALVTGDEDLLALRAEHPILRPAEFVDRHLA